MHTMSPSTSRLPLSILLVEDNRDHAFLMLRAMEPFSREFIAGAVHSLKDARAYLARSRPDLVLSDLALPDGQGIELLPLLGDTIPLVIITSQGDEEVAVKALKAGVMDYLVKTPDTIADLGNTIRANLAEWEHKRHEQWRQNAHRQLQKAEGLSKMAAGIAHDFNNIFQAVQGNIELARMLSQRPEDMDLALSRALKNLERAIQLSKKMLEISGGGLGRPRISSAENFLMEAMPSWRELLGKNVQLELKISENMPEMEFDPDQFSQITGNLVSNAVEAGAQTLWMSASIVRLDAAPTVNAWWAAPFQGKEAICLQIEDDGCGIEEPLLEKVFDPFFTTKQMGRGLGLSVALGLLRQRGAGLQVAHRPEGGTLFRLYFQPMLKPDLPDNTTELLAIPSILLVDDDDNLLECVAEMLEKLSGFHVMKASNGWEAIEIYRNHQDRISLILMDATMPGLSGCETFYRIREINPTVKAILSSGYPMDQGQEASRKCGFVSFLKKPYSLKRLENHIREAMG